MRRRAHRNRNSARRPRAGKGSAAIRRAELRAPGDADATLLGPGASILGAEPRQQALDALVRHAPVGIFQMDALGRVTFVNPRWEAITGRSAERSLGEGWHEVIHTDGREAMLAALDECFRTGREWSQDIRLGTTREVRWVHAHGKPLFSGNGSLAGYVGTVEDITALKTAEEGTQFLAEAGRVLASSLTDRAVLDCLVRLAVPVLADWCVVHLLGGDGLLRPAALAHADPAKEELLHTLSHSYLPDPDALRGVPRVARTGEPEFVIAVSEAMLREIARDEEHHRLLQALGPVSWISMPLLARGRVLGAVSFARSTPGRHYNWQNVHVVQEFSAHAALALENALFYRELQDAERRTAEALALLDTLLSAAPVGFAFLDRDLRYVRVNEYLARLNGVPQDAHLGQTVAGVLPRHADAVEPLLRRALETGEGVVDMEVCYSGSGNPGGGRHGIVGIYPVSGAHGDPMGVGVVVADITARKRAEEALRASEERYRTLVEMSPDAVVVCDLDWRITMANRQMVRLVGAGSASDLIGRLVDDMLDPDARPQFDEAAARLGETGHLAALECRAIRSDGTRFAVELSASLLRDDEGLPTAVIGMGRDITARKRVEEELRQARTRAEEAYLREHRIAVEFQAALLPREEPRIPGFSVSHAHRAAWREADVGGDFYNVLPIDGRHVGLVVGDVGGKGLSAAVIAARVQQSVVALAANERWLPGTVLDGVRRVVETVDPDQLITVFLGILDVETGRMRYASAGHEPALLLRAGTGEIVPLVAGGPAICGFALGSCRTYEAALAEGDLLLVYTDGLPDARAGRGKPLLGHEGVHAVLMQHGDCEPSEVVGALCAAAEEQSEGQLPDDIAVVAVRRLHSQRP